MYQQKTDLSEILDNVGDIACARFIELTNQRELLIQQPRTQSIYVKLSKIENELYEIRQSAGLVSSR